MSEKIGPRVFVVQEPVKKTSDGSYIPYMNLTPASAFGAIKFLIDPRNQSLSTEPTVEVIKQKLANYNDSDFLVPVGDPVAIGIAMVVAALVNKGAVKVLKWNRETSAYIPVSFKV